MLTIPVFSDLLCTNFHSLVVGGGFGGGMGHMGSGLGTWHSIQRLSKLAIYQFFPIDTRLDTNKLQLTLVQSLFVTSLNVNSHYIWHFTQTILKGGMSIQSTMMQIIKGLDLLRRWWVIGTPSGCRDYQSNDSSTSAGLAQVLPLNKTWLWVLVYDRCGGLGSTVISTKKIGARIWCDHTFNWRTLCAAHPLRNIFNFEELEDGSGTIRSSMYVISPKRQRFHFCVIYECGQLVSQSLKKNLTWAKILLAFAQGFIVQVKQTCFASSFPFHLYHSEYTTYWDKLNFRPVLCKWLNLVVILKSAACTKENISLDKMTNEKLCLI